MVVLSSWMNRQLGGLALDRLEGEYRKEEEKQAHAPQSSGRTHERGQTIEGKVA
jgi:hypothetical protein